MIDDLVYLLNEAFQWFKESHPILKVLILISILGFFTLWLMHDSVIKAGLMAAKLIFEHHIWIRLITILGSLLILVSLLILFY